VLFPTSSSSVSEALVSTSQFASNDLLEFGEDEEVERMLQILNSDLIRQELIRRYDLMNHYEIKPTSKYKYTELIKMMDSNIKFRKTEFMSIEITVFDTDPQMASDMANDIAALVDSTLNQMQKNRAREAFAIVEKEYNNLQKEISLMEDSVKRYSELGIYDYESQSRVLSEAYVSELAKGNTRQARNIEERLKVITEQGQSLRGLQDRISFENERLSQLKANYLEAKVDAEQELPHTFIVSKAYPAEKKSYPKRSVIVIVSTLSTFLLALLLFALLDNAKQGA
jgi:uncharacterized protein involved in exopolysaccharide biosynthesis